MAPDSVALESTTYHKLPSDVVVGPFILMPCRSPLPVAADADREVWETNHALLNDVTAPWEPTNRALATGKPLINAESALSVLRITAHKLFCEVMAELTASPKADPLADDPVMKHCSTVHELLKSVDTTPRAAPYPYPPEGARFAVPLSVLRSIRQKLLFVVVIVPMLIA